MTAALTGRLGLSPRDPDEQHRASTPLELLFDLTFVVAVAQAGAALHHDLGTGHVVHGLVSYLMVFFAIWWAWMNFTWFASAYDADDVPYRLLTLLQMAGVLVLAAGVPSAFTGLDYRGVTLGYVVMRVGLVAQWLRAAAGDRARRPIAVRYAVAVGVVQVGWVLRLALPQAWAVASFLLLVGAEIAVPVWAERAAPMTPWHPGHIAERYGLFTLIVLGESILAATSAVQAARASGAASSGVLAVAPAGLVLVFSLWWIYFDVEAGGALRATPDVSFVWGYGHYAIFAAVAALGAGLQVAAETLGRSGSADADHAAAGTPGPAGAAFAVAVPVAVYLVVIGLLHARLGSARKRPATAVGEAVLVLAAAGSARWLAPAASILLVAAVPAAAVAVVTWRRAQPRAAGPGSPAAG